MAASRAGGDVGEAVGIRLSMSEKMEKEKQNSVEEHLCENFSGPLLFDFVWWILSESCRRGFHTIYFLARDGYLLCKMAEMFCAKYSLSIQCRYFYCSRASLRMPSYHLIGEEMYDLLLLDSYRMTVRSMLKRAELNENERQLVYEECKFSQEDDQRILSRQEVDAVRAALKKSTVFRELVVQKSRDAYANAMGYIQQEGMLKNEHVVLVDSGWSGSMQRSLRQLLQSAGYRGSLTGFYFGMFTPPKSPEDGEYLTWYFNSDGRTWDKILFNNNLFECLLSAPHGMTTGYLNREGIFEPVIQKTEQSVDSDFAVKTQIEGVLNYTDLHLKTNDFSFFSRSRALHRTRKLIYRYMAHPKKAEANFFGSISFCDDITNAYPMCLADEAQRDAVKNYLILPRIFRKVFHRPLKKPCLELFWPYGTIAFFPWPKRMWYRWNVYVWEWLRYVIKK